jgi:hypothetical protein
MGRSIKIRDEIVHRFTSGTNPKPYILAKKKEKK